MKEKLSPFQVSILIYMIQSGVVLFSLPRLTGEAFGTNGWIGIIIVYLIVNINLVLIWAVFKIGNGRSFLELMSFIPNWIRMPIYLFLSFIWLTLGTMVMVKFVMILKLLFYPNVSKLLLMLMGLMLCYLLLKGGIYHIAKSTVVLFYFTVWTVFLLLFHLPDFNIVRLTPFLFQGEKDLLKGGMSVYTSLLGYELTLLFLHLLNKNKLKSLIVGNTITSTIYLGVCLVSYGFFGLKMLLEDMYPVITLIEYISFPVLERVENLIFSLFGLKVFITTLMYFWAVKEVLEFQFKKIKRDYIIMAILVLSFIASIFPKLTRDVDRWLEYLAYIEGAIAFILPVLLILLAYFINKSKKGKCL
jgi:spore germination protein (amino acid permease)